MIQTQRESLALAVIINAYNGRENDRAVLAEINI